MSWAPPVSEDNPANQSFGTQPLPGMYSRLPEWEAHPLAKSSPAKSSKRQSFDMNQI
jgi:hypothetical protein